MSQVFVSYKRSDKDFVHRLVDELRRNHFPVWLDEDSIKPGDDWQEAIYKTIQTETSAVIVVLSPEAVDSEWVGVEYNLAMDHGITVIPLIYKPCDVPARLQSLNYVEYFKNPSFDGLIKRLQEIVFSQDLSLLVNRKQTFAETARRMKGAIKVPVPRGGTDLWGLPLGAYHGSLVYLIGQEDHKLEPIDSVQLALQFSNTYGETKFVQQIAEYFLVQENQKDYPLRILLIRGPMILGKDRNTGATLVQHGLLDANPTDWSNALSSIIKAKDVYNKHVASIRELQVFFQGPAVLMFPLAWGLETRFMDKTEVYHLDRGRGYVKVFG